MAQTLLYGSLSLGFATLAIFLLVSEFHLQGFNKYVLLVIAVAMAIITFIVAAKSNRNTQKEPAEQESKTWLFYGKLAFASYAAALAIFMLLAVIGLWLFGAEEVDAHLFENSTVVMLGMAFAVIPLLWKKLQ